MTVGMAEFNGPERAAIQMFTERTWEGLKECLDNITAAWAEIGKKLAKALLDSEVRECLLALEKAVRNQRRREMLEALPDSRMKHLALHAKRKRIRKKCADRLLRRE